jgi:hypothetical protein
MKGNRADLTRVDILGNRDCSSAEEILTAVLKRWRRRLGYCSIFAAVPAILASHISEARSDEAKKPETSVAGRRERFLERLNLSSSNPALLKRQSKFLLPHQRGNFAMLAAVGGFDDCPGRPIPGGNYTVAAPYIDTGDTTGANNTVTSLPYYYTYDAHGPDHVYSFTLTGRGSIDPRIEVSTTSGAYKPLIYVLLGAPAGACPAGTGNSPNNILVMNDSRWTAGSNTAILSNNHMNFLPLNVPLHLFVDSAGNDASGSGPYTLRMQDVTIAPTAAAPACPNPNSIECPEFFVRQHYLDFLGREPDTAGFNDWVSVLNGCGPNQGGLGTPPGCDRVHVSSGFFRSTEFGERGYWLYRFYESALGRRPTFAEFLPELQRLSGLTTSAQQEALRADFITRFMALPGFNTNFNGLTDSPSDAAAFIAKLEQVGRVTLPATATTQPGQPPQYGRQQLIDLMSSGQFTAAQTLRAFIEQKVVWDTYFYRAFVAMQYFGYLRRDPEAAGYDDWVRVLTFGDAPTGIQPGNYRHLIFGFIYSVEYRERF